MFISRSSGLLLLGVFLLSATSSTSYAADVLSKRGDSFENSAMVADNELADMRGGFITINGLMIDFALSTRTVIDGVTQSDILISTNNIDSVTENDLKQLIQVGEGNDAAALEQLSQNPGLLVLVQNSVDNKVIQNFNVLDIAVSNVDQFGTNALMPYVDLSAIEAIR